MIQIVLTATCPFLETATKKVRATRKSLLHVPYGDGEGEKLDIYFPGEVAAEGRPSGGLSLGRSRLAWPPGLSLHAFVCLYRLAFLSVPSRRLLAEWKVSQGLDEQDLEILLALV